MQRIFTYRLNCCLQYLYYQLRKKTILAFICILTCKQV